jgi:hypothetical protein
MLNDADAKFERDVELLEGTKDSGAGPLKISDVYLRLARLRFDQP